MSTGPDPCHRCGGTPTVQWARRATATEAALQRVEIGAAVGRVVDDEYVRARYGQPRTGVTACAAHDLSPAPADQSPEAAAAARQAGVERRAILHAADCAGHGHCACTDPPTPAAAAGRSA